MKLLKLHLESFKGARDAEYDMSKDVVTISGKNGTGKTTVADAWYWLLCDTLYDIGTKKTPEIRPDFMEESEPTVTAEVEIDGKVITLTKRQCDMRTKKQKFENAPVRISNKYEINSVPMAQKVFFSELSKMGVSIE